MRMLTAGVVLGMGLGGFADGIAFHQIAQWHNLGSAVVPPVDMETMSQNMRWDGYFHAVTWLVTVAGVFLLRREVAAQSPLATELAGQMLIGWGLFNLLEGAIDHHLLQLHHVRDIPMHVPGYDWLFLGLGGVGLIVLGWGVRALGWVIHTGATGRLHTSSTLYRGPH